MMMQYAELREPKARRIKRIDSLVDNHVSVGVDVANRSRMEIFEYLEKVPEFMPRSDGERVNL
jgi:hypothetical protein